MTAPEPLPAQRQPSTGPTLADDAEGRYLSYRLGENEYRQYRDVLCAVSREGDPYPVLPGRLAVDEVAELRDVDADLTPADTILDSVFSVTYTPPSGHGRSTRASVVDMDAREPEWHHQLGIAARTARRKLDTIANAVRAMGQLIEIQRGWPQAYASTGLVLRDSVPAFLRQGLPALTTTGTDPDLRCELPVKATEQPGVPVLTMDHPSSPDQFADDLMALLRILDTVPDQPYVPMALLCQLAWAPWSGLPDLGRIPVVLAGDTGLRKTALTGLIVAAQSQSFVGGEGVEVPVTVKMRGNQSTVFGADQALHALGGTVAVVDDYFAGRMTQKEIDEGWKRLSLLGDNSVTGSGGTRGGYRNGRSVLARNVFPRSCILATAEELPDEYQRGSEVARYAALKLSSQLDNDVLSEVQASARACSRAHAAMVQHGLGNLDAPRRGLAWATEQVSQWEFGGHSRVRQGYIKLLAGGYLVGQALQRAGIDPSGFLTEASDQLRAAADDQARRSGMRNGHQVARDPVRLFVRHFGQMLAADPYWLATAERAKDVRLDGGEVNEHPEFQPPSIEGYGPSAVGWRQIGQSGGWTPAGRGDPLGAVYIATGVGRTPWRPVILRMPAARWDQVCDDIARRVRALEGWSMPAPDVLRRTLVHAGYMRAEHGESVPVWSGDKRKRSCLSLDLGRILDGGEDDPTDGSDPAGTLPGPEPGGPAHEVDSGEPGDSDHPHDAAEPDGNEGDGEEQAVQLVCSELGGEVVGVEEAPEPEPEPEPEPSARTPVATAGSGHGDTASSSQPLGVLDVDGLHTPEGVTGLDTVPGNLAEVYWLAVRYGVRQVWLHPRVTAGLPDRPDDVAINAGVPHSWADLAGSGLVSDPDGVAPWLVVWRDGDRTGTSRSIALPRYEPRAPWANAPDGATLLEAVQALNGALGADYYYSPNVTAEQYAYRHSRSVRPCEAILAGAVPPAIRHRQMVQPKTSRTLTDLEDGAVFVHRFDRKAAELAGMNTWLGVGEPERRGGPVVFDDRRDRKLAGYWQLECVPSGVDARLPELRFEPNEDGQFWVTTPDVVLLRWLGVCPSIVDAWVWPDSRQALQSTYRHLQGAREVLLAGKGTVAGGLAYTTHGELYKRLIGDLARTRGARNDRDGLWRPDWRDMIKAQTYCNIYRELVKVGGATERYPIATYADAAYYVSDESEPARAVPDGMTLGTRGGQWEHEGCVPLAAVRRECGERRFHGVFDAELDRRQG